MTAQATLERNVAHNELESVVEPLALALAAAPGRQRLYHAGEDQSRSSLHPPRRYGAVTETPCIGLDGLIADRSPDVVKLDLEGGEVEALRGMGQTLARARRLRLFVECNPRALSIAGSEPAELLGLLTAAGFEVRVIDEEARRLRPPETALCDLRAHVNLYCERPSRAATIRTP